MSGQDSLEIKDKRRQPFCMVETQFLMDGSLSTCEKMVYIALCSFASQRSRECYPFIESIAQRASCSRRQVSRCLVTLENSKYIERELHRDEGQRTVYSIFDLPDKEKNSRDIEPTDKPDPIPRSHEGHDTQSHPPMTHSHAPHDTQSYPHDTQSYPHDIQSHPHDIQSHPHDTQSRGVCHTVMPIYKEYLTRTIEQEKNPLTGEPSAPSPPAENLSAGGSTRFLFELPPSSGWEEPEKIPLKEIPGAMRECVDYFLLKTGREGIYPEELSAVRALEEIHTPARVNREISRTVERYGGKDRPLSGLSFVTVYKALQYQVSLRGSKGKAPPSQAKRPDPYEGCYLNGRRRTQ